MRVLITGSRTWRNGLLIRQKLDQCLLTAQELNDQLIVVHGAAKAGADALADSWGRWHEARSNIVYVERHPAEWEGPCRKQCQPNHRRVDPRGWDVCPAAGFHRNEDMVHLGADLCMAFIADDSKGATHCARYAESQGLSVLYFRENTHALF